MSKIAFFLRKQALQSLIKDRVDIGLQILMKNIITPDKKIYPPPLLLYFLKRS